MVSDPISNKFRKDGLLSLIRQGGSYVQKDIKKSAVKKWVFSNYRELIVDSEQIKSTPYVQVLYNLDENLEAFTESDLEKIIPTYHEYEPRYYPIFKNPFVAQLNNIVIAGPRAASIDPNGKFIADTHDFDPYDKGITGNRLEPAIIESITEHPKRVGKSVISDTQPQYNQSIKIATILYQGSFNYYHWMEHLLKLRGVSYYEQMTDNEVNIIIPKNSPSWIYESLDVLGYDKSRCIEWDGGIINVNKLVVPSFPEFRPGPLRWLRKTARESVGEMNNNPNWIFVSRQNSDNRKIRNYNEVIDICKKHGVKPVYCEDMSVVEQIELFKSIEGVIGVHGAGLANTIWSKDTSVIEIQNNVYKRMFQIMAYCLGNDYIPLSARPIGDAGREMDRDVIVDTKTLDMILKQTV